LTTWRVCTLAAPVRMIHRVHDRTTDLGSCTLPTTPPGLAGGQVLMFRVANLTYCGPTGDMNHPSLARRQTKCGVLAFPGHYLRRCSGRACNPVSYTHLRAHETKANLVCRLLLEKKKKKQGKNSKVNI